MPTIEEIEAQADTLKAAENAALGALADGMRELAVSLPDGSRLAISFANEARTLDTFATGLEPAAYGALAMRNFVRARYRELAPQEARG